MKNSLKALLPLLLVVSIAGCLQTTRKYIINPDGSGKLTIEATMTRPEFAMGGGEEGDAKTTKKQRAEDLRSKIAEIIGESEGIDLWKDVSYRDLGSGKIFFRGTAYFPDFNAVRLQGLSNMRFHLATDGPTMTVTVLEEPDESSADTNRPAPLVNVSDEEIKRRADSIQQEFKMSMAMMRMAFADLSETATFSMPGSVTISDGFAARRGHAFEVVFSGKRLVDVMDSIAAQDAFFEQMARYGGKPPMDDESARLAVWGGKKPMLVARVASKPLFNYAREVSAARKSYAKLRKQLKID